MTHAHHRAGGFRWTRAQRRQLVPGALVTCFHHDSPRVCTVESHDPETTWDPKRNLFEPTGLVVFFPGERGDCICDIEDFDPSTLVPSPHAPNEREMALAGGDMSTAVLLAKYRLELLAVGNTSP